MKIGTHRPRKGRLSKRFLVRRWIGKASVALLACGLAFCAPLQVAAAPEIDAWEVEAPPDAASEAGGAAADTAPETDDAVADTAPETGDAAAEAAPEAGDAAAEAAPEAGGAAARTAPGSGSTAPGSGSTAPGSGSTAPGSGSTAPVPGSEAQTAPSSFGRAGNGKNAGQSGANVFSGDGITLSLEYGYNNMAKGGRYLPVRIQLENSRQEDLNGTLQIQTVESDGTIYRYEFPASVSAGNVAEIREYIPLGSRAAQLYLVLEDQGGNRILEREVKLNISWDVPEMFIGILSNHPERLQYLNGVGISYGAMRTRTFTMDPDRFPAEEQGLNLLDVLVVNDYKLRELSEEQTVAIMDWVRSGGVLLLGTGDSVDDTLGRYAPELLDESYGTPNMRHIDLGEDFILEDADSGMLVLDCVDVPLHGGDVVISSNGMALLTVAAKEQGLVGVAAFDLGDIAHFCEQQVAYVDFFLTSLVGEDRINTLSEVLYSGNSSKFWSVQTLINTGNLEKLPNLPLYAVVTVIYLFLLGPGMYLFLKHRGLQTFYRRGVLVLALVFSAAVYFMGMGTRFRGTFYSYATIQDVTSDYVTETTYINIRNPYNRPYSAHLDPSYSVLPITRSSLYVEPVQEDLAAADYQVAIRRDDGNLTIDGQNTAPFSPRYFQLEKKTENAGQVGFTGNVGYFEGKVSGTITNNFPFPVENTALVLYGNLVYVDRMEAGETKELDGLKLLRYPLNNSYVVAEWVAGEKNFAEMNIDDTRYLLAMKRANMLMFYMDNYMTTYTADARVLAFSTEKEESRFLKDLDPETYGLTMPTSEIAVNASQDSSIYRSVLVKAPKVLNGQYDASSNSMFGLEPVTLQYQMGTDIQVESLTFEAVSPEFLSGYDYIEAFSGGIYFYNHSTGNFDRMDELQGRTLDVSQLRPYLSPGNILTVRYVYQGTGSYNSIQLPMPMVAGREQ